MQGLRAFRNPYVSASVKVSGRATHFHGVVHGIGPLTFMGLGGTWGFVVLLPRHRRGWVGFAGGWMGYFRVGLGDG